MNHPAETRLVWNPRSRTSLKQQWRSADLLHLRPKPRSETGTFQCTLLSQLYRRNTVSFVWHSNLNMTNRAMTQPSFRGTSVLTGSLGQYLEHLLWQKQSKKSYRQGPSATRHQDQQWSRHRSGSSTEIVQHQYHPPLLDLLMYNQQPPTSSRSAYVRPATTHLFQICPCTTSIL